MSYMMLFLTYCKFRPGSLTTFVPNASEEPIQVFTLIHVRSFLNYSTYRPGSLTTSFLETFVPNASEEPN